MIAFFAQCPRVGCAQPRALLTRRLASSASLSVLVLAGVALFGACAGQAETISGALAKSYGYSPDLNQQRAATRAADEAVPRATAGCAQL